MFIFTEEEEGNVPLAASLLVSEHVGASTGSRRAQRGGGRGSFDAIDEEPADTTAHAPELSIESASIAEPDLTLGASAKEDAGQLDGEGESQSNGGMTGSMMRLQQVVNTLVMLPIIMRFTVHPVEVSFVLYRNRKHLGVVVAGYFAMLVTIVYPMASSNYDFPKGTRSILTVGSVLLFCNATAALYFFRQGSSATPLQRARVHEISVAMTLFLALLMLAVFAGLSDQVCQENAASSDGDDATRRKGICESHIEGLFLVTIIIMTQAVLPRLIFLLPIVIFNLALTAGSYYFFPVEEPKLAVNLSRIVFNSVGVFMLVGTAAAVEYRERNCYLQQLKFQCNITAAKQRQKSIEVILSSAVPRDVLVNALRMTHEVLDGLAIVVEVERSRHNTSNRKGEDTASPPRSVCADDSIEFVRAVEAAAVLVGFRRVRFYASEYVVAADGIDLGQRLMNFLNIVWQRLSPAGRLTFRAGAHYGLFVGATGAGHYGVYGEVVRIARALKNSAEAGTVLATSHVLNTLGIIVDPVIGADHSTMNTESSSSDNGTAPETVVWYGTAMLAARAVRFARDARPIRDVNGAVAAPSSSPVVGYDGYAESGTPSSASAPRLSSKALRKGLSMLTGSRAHGAQSPPRQQRGDRRRPRGFSNQQVSRAAASGGGMASQHQLPAASSAAALHTTAAAPTGAVEESGDVLARPAGQATQMQLRGERLGLTALGSMDERERESSGDGDDSTGSNESAAVSDWVDSVANPLNPMMTPAVSIGDASRTPMRSPADSTIRPFPTSNGSSATVGAPSAIIIPSAGPSSRNTSAGVDPGQMVVIPPSFINGGSLSNSAASPAIGATVMNTSGLGTSQGTRLAVPIGLGLTTGTDTTPSQLGSFSQEPTSMIMDSNLNSITSIGGGRASSAAVADGDELAVQQAVESDLQRSVDVDAPCSACDDDSGESHLWGQIRYLKPHVQEIYSQHYFPRCVAMLGHFGRLGVALFLSFAVFTTGMQAEGYSQVEFRAIVPVSAFFAVIAVACAPLLSTSALYLLVWVIVACVAVAFSVFTRARVASTAFGSNIFLGAMMSALLNTSAPHLRFAPALATQAAVSTLFAVLHAAFAPQLYFTTFAFHAVNPILVVLWQGGLVQNIAREFEFDYANDKMLVSIESGTQRLQRILELTTPRWAVGPLLAGITSGSGSRAESIVKCTMKNALIVIISQSSEAIENRVNGMSFASVASSMATQQVRTVTALEPGSPPQQEDAERSGQASVFSAQAYISNNSSIVSPPAGGGGGVHTTQSLVTYAQYAYRATDRVELWMATNLPELVLVGKHAEHLLFVADEDFCGNSADAELTSFSDGSLPTGRLSTLSISASRPLGGSGVDWSTKIAKMMDVCEGASVVMHRGDVDAAVFRTGFVSCGAFGTAIREAESIAAELHQPSGLHNMNAAGDSLSQTARGYNGGPRIAVSEPLFETVRAAIEARRQTTAPFASASVGDVATAPSNEEVDCGMRSTPSPTTTAPAAVIALPPLEWRAVQLVQGVGSESHFSVNSSTKPPSLAMSPADKEVLTPPRGAYPLPKSQVTPRGAKMPPFFEVQLPANAGHTNSTGQQVSSSFYRGSTSAAGTGHRLSRLPSFGQSSQLIVTHATNVGPQLVPPMGVSGGSSAANLAPNYNAAFNASNGDTTELAHYRPSTEEGSRPHTGTSTVPASDAVMPQLDIPEP